jgi:lipopolysaccharide/colanic/teichoic acid biosynthesis glycosyltransferase
MQKIDYEFPYKKPDDKIIEEYTEIFKMKKPLKDRPSKIAFDKLLSVFLMTLFSPFILILWIAQKIEGMLNPETRGPFLFGYTSVSKGKKFKKYKIRVCKGSLLGPDKWKIDTKSHRTFPSERVPSNLTKTGKFIKDHYLDEIPQIYSIFKGDMSFVGPRPTSEEHYERDIGQGNIHRQLIKGGIMGAGHVRKGTSLFANPALEYGYVRKYMTFTWNKLLLTDITIIARGIKLIIEGKGF